MSKLLNSCLVLLPFALLSWVPSCVETSPANPDQTTPPIIVPLDTLSDDDYSEVTPDAEPGIRCSPVKPGSDLMCPPGQCYDPTTWLCINR